MYLEFGVELGRGKGAELLTHSSYRSCHRDILVLSRRTSHLIIQSGPPNFFRRQQGLQELTGVQNPTSLASLLLTSLPPAAGKGQACARGLGPEPHSLVPHAPLKVKSSLMSSDVVLAVTLLVSTSKSEASQNPVLPRGWGAVSGVSPRLESRTFMLKPLKG